MVSVRYGEMRTVTGMQNSCQQQIRRKREVVHYHSVGDRVCQQLKKKTSIECISYPVPLCCSSSLCARGQITPNRYLLYITFPTGASVATCSAVGKPARMRVSGLKGSPSTKNTFGRSSPPSTWVEYLMWCRIIISEYANRGRKK